MSDNSYLFIVNPNSGTTIGKNQRAVCEAIETFARRHSAHAHILFTKESGHATHLVREHLTLRNWKAVVAVGGDGTVNEVAKVLVHKPLALGILPLGSGNGLARHLGLPLTPVAALTRLFEGNPIVIDSAELNGIPFFCTAGVGFDAYVGALFSRQSSRGLATYASVAFKSFWNFKPQHFLLNGKDTEAFSLTIANAGQYGNNAWIAPEASVQDGFLDICVIRPFPAWFGVNLAYRMFSKSLKPSGFVSYETLQHVLIESANPPLIHYDGEPLQLDTTRIQIDIRPKSLCVIV